ncbi:hypothetical protein ADIARSV_4266 [Arcticibacter svalbardensis MN12-7]|uniref:Uncharacterized protein n=1 Tax=Arcticibacter svalbardensis MN12-7 TaxID=1150600 RepID=R9GUI5_9SPHI|nr:hypothetical protein [Arcticibacter svalbardensis]EOR92579.1 hypothetical protein ADIARSV_4266 [Arcticibacter svalbardensis MN12-7]
MIRKDFIEAEIQKLGQILAKILGLKNDGNVDDGIDLAFQALSDTFGLTKEYLETSGVEDFQLFLKTNSYSAEKLNLLAQLMFETVYPFQEEKETILILHKTAAILNLLETEHHQQSFENIARREQITNFLNNLQYE